jgi:hypothetical protein
MTNAMIHYPTNRTCGIAALGGACAAAFLLALSASNAFSQSVTPPERKILEGIATTRVVQGMPYQLAGKRVVFANWYYIQPGDVDWRDADGKHVDLQAGKGPFEVQHAGINAPRGIRIVAEKPHVVGPMFRPHRMTLRDGDVYKGWTDNEYYESADAMHWDKKAALGLDAGVGDGIYHVFIDSQAPSQQRFKAIWTGSITRSQFDAFRAARPNAWEPRAIFLLGEKDEVACLRGGVSPDGIHWTTLPDPLVVEYCDTFNTAYFDRVLGEYIIYTRYWSVGPRSDNLPPDIRNSWTGVGRRAIGRASSHTFGRFAPSEMILEPSPDMLPSEQLYTNCHTTVPGAPDVQLMFPTIWNASVDDTTRIVLASSHDGKTWHWVPGGDLLRTQPFGHWDGGCIWVTPDLIELPGGDWVLPYLGHNVPHKYPRGQRTGGTGYAVWPKGRLVAVEAEDQGEFTMMPLVAPGKTLTINAMTLRTGWVKIEVVGANGRSLADCIPIVGDQHWARVKWNAADDLGIGAGNAVVTLRVQMKQAKIFGLQVD